MWPRDRPVTLNFYKSSGFYRPAESMAVKTTDTLEKPVRPLKQLASICRKIEAIRDKNFKCIRTLSKYGLNETPKNGQVE